MIKTVIKRSGRKQDFEKGKIVEAIKKAILSVRQDIDEKKLKN